MIITLLLITYVVISITFRTFFVQSFKIVVGSWKFSILLQYILWDDWPIFMPNFRFKLTTTVALEYTLRKTDCHSWWISKMQSGREEERYAIKLCFKLWKIAAFGASCMNRVSVFERHKRFKESRESVRDG